jgi:hypothetical protein
MAMLVLWVVMLIDSQVDTDVSEKDTVSFFKAEVAVLGIGVIIWD